MSRLRKISKNEKVAIAGIFALIAIFIFSINVSAVIIDFTGSPIELTGEGSATLNSIYTLPFTISNGVPPYYIDYFECDASMPLPQPVNITPANISLGCTFTTTGQHIINVVGGDSGTKSFHVVWDITVNAQPPAGGNTGGNTGGGGGGGGGGIPTCTPAWQCSKWSECVNGIINRVCIDTNKCSTSQNKPNESVTCQPYQYTATQNISNVQANDFDNTSVNNSQNITQKGSKTANKANFLNTYTIAGAILIILAVIIGILILNHHNKSPTLEVQARLETWIEENMSKGYTMEQMEKYLMDMNYRREDIQEAMKRFK